MIGSLSTILVGGAAPPPSWRPAGIQASLPGGKHPLARGSTKGASMLQLASWVAAPMGHRERVLGVDPPASRCPAAVPAGRVLTPAARSSTGSVLEDCRGSAGFGPDAQSAFFGSGSTLSCTTKCGADPPGTARSWVTGCMAQFAWNELLLLFCKF